MGGDRRSLQWGRTVHVEGIIRNYILSEIVSVFFQSIGYVIAVSYLLRLSIPIVSLWRE